MSNKNNPFTAGVGLLHSWQKACVESVQAMSKAVMSVTPKPIEEFTEAEIDGEWKIYVEGEWISFDAFIEKYKTLRDKVNK